MSVVVLRVKAGNDPLGTPLVTLTDDDLETFGLRVAENALGSARFTINRHNAKLRASPAADLLDGGSYVDVTFPLIDPDPVFGFWLDEHKDTLIAKNEEGGEFLSRGGPGVLFILSHALLLDTIHDPSQTARGDYSVDPWWTWVEEPYGAILTRGITEGQTQPGTPLQDVTIDFDRTSDSDSNLWPLLGEEKLIQLEWGTDLLMLYQRLIASGQIFVRARANLLIQAYMDRGPDRTGAFGAGVVRFEKGVNIDTELVRVSAGSRAADHAFVKGKDNVVRQVSGGLASSPGRWVSVDYSDTDDPNLLEAIGQEVLRIRGDDLEGLEFELRLGDDEAAGLYLPWQHFDTGTLATLHTGSGPNEYDEADARITGFRVELRQASSDATDQQTARSIACILELNSGQALPLETSGLEARPGSTHSHPRLDWLPHKRYDDFNRTPSSPVAIGATPSPLIGAARSGRAWMVSATAAATVEMDGNKAVFVIGASPAVVRAYVQDPNGVWLSDKRDPPNPYLCHFYLLTRFSIAAVSTATRQVRFWVGDGEISTGADIDTNSGTVFVQDPTNGVSKAKKDWAATTYDLLWEKVPFGYSRAKLWRVNGPVFPPEEWTVASENLPPTGEGALNDTQLGFSYEGLAGDNFTVEFIDIIHGSYAPGLAVDVGSFTAVSKWGLD